MVTLLNQNQHQIKKNKNAEAIFCIGLLYFIGIDVPININKAIKYYKLAADMNHANAQYNLAIIYKNSEYGIHDIDKSLHYLINAADQNEKNAQSNLGNLYLQNKLINKAIYYLKLAAQKFNREALCLLGYIYDSGFFGGICRVQT